jgi:hypothetical protein
MKKISLQFFFIFAFINMVFAQNEVKNEIKYLDEVRLKNGNVFIGKMIEFNENTIIMDIQGGFRLSIDQKEVKNIRQKTLFPEKEIIIGTPEELGEKLKDAYTLQVNSKGKITLLKKYKFREKGTYGSAILGYMGKDFVASSISASLTGGYLLSRKLGVGIGTGVFYYSNGNRENIVFPVYAEVRSYLSSRRRAPYFSMKTGYGFVSKGAAGKFSQTGIPITKVKGDIFLNPAFGVRLGASEDINMTMEVGFNYQKSQIFFQTDPVNIGLEWRKETFRRVYIGIGLVF